MQRSLIALAAALAFAGGSAMAQQQDPAATPSAKDSQSSGESLTDKAKDTAHKIGEKTKELFHRGSAKADSAKADHDSKSARSDKDDTRSMGSPASDSATSSDSGRQQRMDKAYGDYQQKSGSQSSTSGSSTSR